MSAAHRDGSPHTSPFSPHDDHYSNEHSSRRRRTHDTPAYGRVHYPGDGYDFRRPVMSAAAGARDASVNGRRNDAPVIDLTDEDGAEESQGSERHTASTVSTDPGPAGSSRAQRLPRFGRPVIDVESSAEEEEHDTSHLPGANYLALPLARPTRPQFSGLRRPARLPSPPAGIDDVEFVEERPRSRPHTMSRQPTPATAAAPPARGPRSVTPYPTNIHQTIDLTEEDDDDIVLLNTQQRDWSESRPSKCNSCCRCTCSGRSRLWARRPNCQHVTRRRLEHWWEAHATASRYGGIRR